MSLSAKDKLRSKQQVCIAVIGDSTTCGFGSNGDANWDINSPFVIQPFGGFVLQSVQDNIAIPSASRLTQTWLKQLNPASTFYNMGYSGGRADEHVTAGTVSVLASRSPRPDLIIIALGINSAKNGQSQSAALTTLVQQVQSHGIQCVISLGHNVANLNTTIPMPFWLTMRSQMKAIANAYGCEIIDPGSDDNAITPALTHDGFHPSALGYIEIFKKYKEFLGGVVKISNKSFNTSVNGALRIKSTSGTLKLNLTRDNGATKIKTSMGVFTIN
jgi:lysophospholipase L1-like esterase